MDYMVILPPPRLQGPSPTPQNPHSKLSDPFNGYRAFSRKVLETLDQDFDPSCNVKHYILRKKLRIKSEAVIKRKKYIKVENNGPCVFFTVI